jgi:hypothetical protein
MSEFYHAYPATSHGSLSSVATLALDPDRMHMLCMIDGEDEEGDEDGGADFLVEDVIVEEMIEELTGDRPVIDSTTLELEPTVELFGEHFLIESGETMILDEVVNEYQQVHEQSTVDCDG